MGQLKKLKELLDDFNSITDPHERSDMLIYYADQFKQVPDSIATKPYPEENRVPGCESEAFVFAQRKDSIVKFYYAVENPQGISAKALAAILTEITDGLNSEEVQKIYPELVYELFGKNVAMQRGLGLRSMISMTKALAKEV
jgi:cysteine desulfuration protein SufE